MFRDIVVRIDTRTEANASQSDVFGQPTTDLYTGVLGILQCKEWETATTEQEMPRVMFKGNVIEIVYSV